jgi:hypothetical protein
MRKSAPVAAAVSVGVLAFVATVPAATNLLANGTFEGSGSGSLSGWAASGGTISLVAGNGGGHAARIAVSNAGAQAYAYTSSKPVTNATAGTAYTLDGSVRTSTAGTVCLKLKEVPSGGTTTVGSAQQCVAASASWQAFPTVAYTVAQSGDSLTVNVVEAAPAAGATFDIDDLVLATGTAAPDTAKPSVPAGVSATATGSTSAKVAWTASTDNVGVTGYDVYRDGSKLTSVPGSVTSFTDASLAAGTTYSFPNYLAVTSGTFNTCLACSSSADNIFHQLDAAGTSWKDHNQSMPRNCAPNTSS